MTNSPKRFFSVGSQWLYYKIYTGQKTADRIIFKYLQTQIGELVELGLIEKWFFIRYNDPDFHLRLRFYTNQPQKNIGKIIQHLRGTFDYLMQEDLVWNVVLDTYKREIERYGPNSIDQVESLFFQESTMLLPILEETYDDVQARWLFALFYIDQYLDCFQLNLSEKGELLKIFKNTMKVLI